MLALGKKDDTRQVALVTVSLLSYLEANPLAQHFSVLAAGWATDPAKDCLSVVSGREMMRSSTM